MGHIMKIGWMGVGRGAGRGSERILYILEQNKEKMGNKRRTLGVAVLVRRTKLDSCNPRKPLTPVALYKYVEVGRAQTKHTPSKSPRASLSEAVTSEQSEQYSLLTSPPPPARGFTRHTSFEGSVYSSISTPCSTF